MGSVCCVAGREKTVPHGENTGSSLHHVYTHRNVIYSPSWSFQWDSRSHMGNSIDSSLQLHPDALRNSANTIGQSKGSFALDTLSDGGSPIESFQTPSWPKSPVFSDAVEDFAAGGLDMRSNPSASNKASAEDNVKRSATEGKMEKNAVVSASSSLKPKDDPSSSRSPTFAPNLTSSRQTRRSPGHPLSRQISDSRILAFKSLESPASEGRPSFVLSACSNDMTLGSHGGSSDGWSMRTFSELVASSQRERWSFDSENMSSNPGRITRSNSMHFSPPMNFQSCGLCLKSLVDRSPFICGTDVVAVLVCGHVYHAECLESTTLDAESFDPRCPACTSIGKLPLKRSPGKALRVELDAKGRHRISRIGVADGDFQQICYSGPICSRQDGKGPKMAASSSTRGSFAKPFLKRHFSFGSRPSRSLAEHDSARRKGFWARYFKE